MDDFISESSFALTVSNVSERAAALVDDDVLRVAKASKAPNTLLAYKTAWTHFRNWTATRGVSALPALPETIAAYLVARMKEGRKASTLAVAVAAIRHAHKAAGLTTPTEHEAVSMVVRGIRRTIGTAPIQKQPATAERVSAMLAHVGPDIQGLRDRALILLGMAGAFRRSELIALNFEDLTFTENGVDIFVRRSKTDQEGEGYLVAIPTGESLRPVAAVKAWIAAAGITDGPLFRPVNKGGRIVSTRLTGWSVAKIVKGYAERAGLETDDFSGHSLRAGFVTSAAERGADINRIMDVTRHVDPRTVRRYIRRSERYKDHAGTGFL
jgi:site-specific recombinase XerD